MNNHELEIVMRLKDEVSKRLQGLQGNLVKFSNAARELGSSLKQVGREISQMGSTVTFLGAAITGPLILAFKNADKYSSSVHLQMERLKNTTIAFQVSVANALVPVIQGFTNALGVLLQKWNSLGPIQQQMIVQTVFMTGVYLTVGGAVVTLAGKLIRLGGIITNLIGRFTFLISVHPILAAIYITIGLIVMAMWKWKAVADAVMNTLEVSFNTILQLFDGIKTALWSMVAGLSKFMESIANLLTKMPVLGAQFKALAQQWKAMGDAADQYANNNAQKVLEKHEKIKDILLGSSGDWAAGFDKFKGISGELDKFLADLKNLKVNIPEVAERLKSLQEISDEIFSAMNRDLSDFVYNSFLNKSFKLVDFFRQMGQSILRIWADTLAQMVTNWLKTTAQIQTSGGSSGSWLSILGTVAGIVGGFAGGTAAIAGKGGYGANTPQGVTNMGTWSKLPTRHLGGLIYAHSGLAVDEVPIIAQTGERVLSRSQNREYEKNMNGGMGQIAIHPTIIIQAIDAQSGVEFVLKNKGTIGQALSDEILKNAAIRGTIKRFATN